MRLNMTRGYKTGVARVIHWYCLWLLAVTFAIPWIIFANQSPVEKYSEGWFLSRSLASARATNRVDRLKCAIEMEDLAKDCSEPELKAKLLYHAGSFYCGQIEGESDFERVNELFEEVLKLNPSEDVVVLGTLRQLAQIHSAAGKPESANKYYEEIERRLNSETNTITPGFKKKFLENIYPKLADVKERMGDSEGALLVREKALEVSSESKKAQILLEKARQLAKDGKKEEALECFLNLFKDYTDFGKDNGDIIYYLMEYVRVNNFNERSDEYIDSLFDIWEKFENEKHLQIFNVGHNLSVALFSRNDERFLEYSEILKSKLKEALRTNTVENIKKYNLKLCEEQLAYCVAMYEDGKLDINFKKEKLLSFIDDFPNNDNTKYVINRYVELENKMREEEILRTQKWKRFFISFAALVALFIPSFILYRKG